MTSLATASCFGQLITSVIQANGRTDRPNPQWTGQTFEQWINGTRQAYTYTVPFFGEEARSMPDRLFQYNGASTTLALPSYLVGGEYVMTANNNRTQVPYRLDISVSAPVRAYLLVDNRVGDNNTENPPDWASRPDMAWVVDQGWLPMSTGLNRSGNLALPDEVGWDEDSSGDTLGIGAGVSINDWGSVYYHDFSAGTFSTYTENQGVNIYGVVVTTIPEPAAFPLLGLGLAALICARRVR